MAIDTSEEVYTESDEEVEDERERLDMPAASYMSNVAEWQAWGKTLPEDFYGLKTCKKNLDRLKQHANLANKALDYLVNAVARYNGDTIAAHSGPMRQRKQFIAIYKGLSTPALRAQCQAAHLDYDSYEDQEDIIEALVDYAISQMLKRSAE